MMFRRENIEQKIVDLQRMLATADDQLEIALLKMAIESFLTEMDSLLPADNQRSEANTESGPGTELSA